MGYYADATDLETRAADQWLPLADTDGDGFADLAVVEAALAFADHLVDAFLSMAFVTPGPTDSEILKDAALAIALAHLYQGRPLPDHVKAAKDEATTRLAAIGKGELPIAGLEPTFSDACDHWLKGAEDRTMSPTTLDGFA